MKKTVKVNLSGQVFTLDEDAYQILKEYLDKLNKYFKGLEGGDEIISDIESRIAEIFQSKLNDKKEVISLEDVEGAITIMGQPEDIFDNEAETDQETRERSYSSRKENRKLYRDPENAILGGVGSGLAAYFGIEAWIIRLLLVLFFLPVQLVGVIYIILWIVLPKAETPAQRLEMRGEEVTVKNIEKKVKEEYQNVKENVNKAKKSTEFQKTKNVLDEIFHVIGRIIVVFLKVILIIIGVTFIIAGLGALTGLTGIFAFSNTFFPFAFHGTDFFSLREFFAYFMDPGTVTIFGISLFFTVTIPLIALIYGGFKMVLRFKANDRVIALTGLVLWVISLMFLVTTVLFEGRNQILGGPQSTSETEELDSFTSDTLFIKINPDPDIEGFNGEWYYEGDKKQFTLSEYDRLHKKINLNIRSSEDDEFEISLYRKTTGRNKSIARFHNTILEYFWLQKENSLILDPYFSKPKRYRDESSRMKVTVTVPAGKYLHLHMNTKFFLDDIEGVQDDDVQDLAGKTLIMGPTGVSF